MAQADLSNKKTSIITGKDNVVIVDNYQSVRGGRTLDVTGYTLDVINAGHVIIKETATGEYKPMPLTGSNDAYAALPGGHTYEGILIASVPTSKPFAGIMLRGTVNFKAAPFPMENILTDLVAANPLIKYVEE